MARINVVKSARKPQGKCERCGKELQVGMPYKWIEPRAYPGAFSRKRVRCTSCPNWRPSETTSSAARAAVYGAQEEAGDEIALWSPESGKDALVDIVHICGQGVREGAEAYRESAENMVSGFGHETAISEELNEKADTLESAADELESVDIEDFDEDTARQEAEAEVLPQMQDELSPRVLVAPDSNPHPVPRGERSFDIHELDYVQMVDSIPEFDSAEYERRVNKLVQERLEEWGDNVRDQAQEAIDNIEIP